MSVSKTSKLLNYINYSTLLPAPDGKLASCNCDLGCPDFCFESRLPCTKELQSKFTYLAGMRVTLIDGRHIVGR